MKTLNLSQSISPDTPVYPGDPAIEISQEQTLDADEWNMQRIHMNTHDATHVNAPIHACTDGKTLSEISLDHFFGPCTKDMITDGSGVIFTGKLTQTCLHEILKHRPRFVGFDHILANDELELERQLCKAGIVFYEGLVHVNELPNTFTFCGFPLNIEGGDGSPVRAIATF